MTQMLRNRWLHATVFMSALIALGVGIYRFTPPEPMSVIDAGDGAPLCLADAGRRLATLPPGHDYLARPHLSDWRYYPGPLQLWDTRTGAEIARYFSVDDRFGAYAVSKDGRYFAAEVSRNMV